jgi:MFS family permease
MTGSTGGRYRDALRQRDFRLMVVAFVVDALGGWAYSVVLAIYVWDRTHSTQWLAAMASAGWLTSLLVGGYAGVLADRYERTRLMIVSALSSAAVMCVIAVVVGTNGPLALLLALRVISAAAASPYRPASGALTPEIVGEKDLAAANGLFSTLESLVVVLGPAAGGLLLLTGEPVTGVVVNAASFVIAAGIVTRLKVRATGDAAPGENAFKQWLVGIKALGHERVALVLVLFCGLDSAVYGASTVIYVPLSEHLGTGANGYSYLLAGAALGGVIAAGLANKLGRSSRLAPVILGSIVLQALPFAVTATVHAPVLAFVLQVISGAGMIIVDVLAYTALQRDLPREVLGRVLGVFDAIVLSFIVAASFIGAALLTSTGLHTTLLAIGFAFPLMALVGLPALLKADRESAAAVARLAPRRATPCSSAWPLPLSNSRSPPAPSSSARVTRPTRCGSSSAERWRSMRSGRTAVPSSCPTSTHRRTLANSGCCTALRAAPPSPPSRTRHCCASTARNSSTHSRRHRRASP